MFRSFFPMPKIFFLSAIGWFFVSLFVWYGFAADLAPQFSLMDPLPELAEGERPPFLTPEKIWLYQYLILTCVLFCIGWYFIDRSRWYFWSVCGSTIILVVSYFQVQLGVWINDWYGEFFDLIQRALSTPDSVDVDEYYGSFLTVVYILIPNILLLVLFAYFVSHYVFRWRTAMNDFYVSHWAELRDVEGASQRIQEDTMRFADIMEGLGSNFVTAIMTLIAFLPVLWGLSGSVTELPFIGPVDGSLVILALLSASFGTVLLAAVGYKLPGLQFNNQKVEAAYRKELVYGEDSADRAKPEILAMLFADVRRNYYRLYFHYMYFNLFRYAYLQGSGFLTYLVLGPAIVTGSITLGIFQQINQAFGRVEGAFQFLVNSWTTIVELISIYKRLHAFESRIGEYDEKPTEPALEM